MRPADDLPAKDLKLDGECPVHGRKPRHGAASGNLSGARRRYRLGRIARVRARGLDIGMIPVAH